ncbi:hypothetical protein C8J57DRAFT_1520205 [Mycena rebaudengoi]|nr:hypothetical protein C8J57DRAFT_1520205 [Mycena rebaudengoi]
MNEAHADLIATGIVDVPAVVEDPKNISSPPGKKSSASAAFSPPTTLLPDTLLLLSGPTVLKILAAAVTSARILSALVAAVRHIARSTTRERDPQRQAGAFNIVSLILIRARLPRHAQHRALPACPACESCGLTLDPSNENFWIAATQIDSGSTIIKEKAVDLTTVIINPPVVEVSNSGVVPVAPLTLHPPRLEPSVGATPELMLQELKTALQAAEANWLSTLICSWPEPCAPQDDDDILWNFARHFMAWRDDQTERRRLETAANFLARQISTVISLQHLHRKWRIESLAAWKNAHSRRAPSQRSTRSTNTLQPAIQVNATRRMLREARIISILGQLIVAWKTHLTGGVASLSSGPGLYSDLRILQECRAMADEDQTIEDILEACNATPGSLAVMNPGDTLVGRVSSDFSSLAGEYLGDTMSQDDRSEKIEGHRKDRNLHYTLRNVLKPRREIIQDQWNKIAREAGAAGIEFVNEVDDEEVPPGIGILFPYVERSYLFDIGIAEPTALDGKSGCNNARPGRCPCASVSSSLKNGPAYTQGLFAFTTESEIVECNSACGCSPQCNNRLAQFPRQLPAQIFKTEKRGWGARLPVDIVRGHVVGLYTGRASYCFDLDINEDPHEETPEKAYSVDAYGCGNWTRFINHSCSPNLQIITVVYDTMPEASLLLLIYITTIPFKRSRVNLFFKDNMPYLALVATEDIPAFRELTLDYNLAHQTECELKRYREKTRSKKNKSKKQTRCLCGASICRGWLSVVA